MKRLLTFLIPFLLLLSSCDYFIAHPDQERPKIYMFSIGLGYGTGPENNVLENTLSDSDAMAKEIEALAKLPSKEVLIAKLLGTLNAPISALARVLNAPVQGLAIALNAIATK